MKALGILLYIIGILFLIAGILIIGMSLWLHELTFALIWKGVGGIVLGVLFMQGRKALSKKQQSVSQ